MGRPLRHIPEGGALVEITLSTIQGRYLLRPDARGRVNEVVLGVVGRAQCLYAMSIVGISVLSTHLHMLAFPEDAEQMAAFMRHVDGNLSIPRRDLPARSTVRAVPATTLTAPPRTGAMVRGGLVWCDNSYSD